MFGNKSAESEHKSVLPGFVDVGWVDLYAPVLAQVVLTAPTSPKNYPLSAILIDSSLRRPQSTLTLDPCLQACKLSTCVLLRADAEEDCCAHHCDGCAAIHVLRACTVLLCLLFRLPAADETAITSGERSAQGAWAFAVCACCGFWACFSTLCNACMHTYMLLLTKGHECVFMIDQGADEYTSTNIHSPKIHSTHPVTC